MDRHSSEIPLLRPIRGTVMDGGDLAVDEKHHQSQEPVPSVPLSGPVFRRDDDDEEGLVVGGVDFMKILHGVADPKSTLVIKPRIMYFTRYMPSFVASEFVLHVLQKNWCETRVQAVAVGQFLLDEGYIARCAKNADGEDRFEDNYVLFRFRVTDQQNLFADFTPAERRHLSEGDPRKKVKGHTWLEIPVIVFSIALATSGLANVWMSMALLWPAAGLQYVAYVLLALTALLFVFFCVLYALKMVFRWPAFKQELGHPIFMNLYSPISMTLLSMGIALLPVNKTLAEAIWWVAAPLQALVALVTASEWVMRPRDLAVMTPHMFLPVVGLALIPIGGASLGFKPVGMLFFGVSMTFWVMLFTMMLQRLFFLGVLPCKLVPSMFISVAPPCLVGLAYVNLKTVDSVLTDALFPTAMYGVATFFVLLMIIIRFRHVSIPLSTSWWAYVFPFANYASFTVWWHRSLSTLPPDGSTGELISFVYMILVCGLATVAWIGMAVFQTVYVMQRRLYLPVAAADEAHTQ